MSKYDLLPIDNNQNEKTLTIDELVQIYNESKKQEQYQAANKDIGTDYIILFFGVIFWIVIIYVLYKVFKYIKENILNNKHAKQEDNMTINKDAIKKEFLNLLKVNIPMTEEEFKEEYDFLLKTLETSQSLPELEAAFHDIKDHIKFRFEFVKRLSQATSSNYISKYRRMFASLKESYEIRLNELSNSLSTTESSETTAKSSWINKIGYALLLFILFFVFKGIFYAVKANANEYNLEQDLRSIVTANAHLYPIIVDSTVRADSIASNRNSLIFLYTITAYNAEQARRDTELQVGLYFNTLNNSCKNAKKLLLHGANIVHVYNGNDNRHVKTFTINKSQCDKLE